MLIAILAAVVAGACFAMAGILQQRVANTRPEGESLSPRLLADLVKQRLWVAGIGLAFLAYAFQGLALAFGPLSLVQPILVVELVFAIPVSAWLHHMKVGWRNWCGVVAVGGGLAVAIAAASPHGGDPTSAPLIGWIALLVAASVVTAVALLLGRKLSGTVRASLFAVAAATVMGTQSALFAITTQRIPDGFVALFTAWQTYLLVIASIGGLTLIQSAYQAGPLAATTPVINAGKAVVAITIGLSLFNEAIADGLVPRVIAAAAMIVVFIGIVVLDTSPATQRLHAEESEAEEATSGDEQIHLKEQ
ncbi:MAG TPA: DMT family transporter [Nocardioidaceae bacterium]|nr:DMT family transporter [Nocardioidaceae bacterium]